MPGRRELRADAGQRDVPLEHRRVHQARRVADLRPRVVVDEVLLVDRRVVLGRDEPGPVVGPVVVLPVDDQPGEAPARGLLGDLALDGAAADERPVVVGQAAEHPRPAELDRRRAVLVGPAEPARAEVDVEQEQPGLDPQHVQRREPERQDAEALERRPHRVPDLERGLGRDPHLEAEVAAVAGPRDRHGRARDGALGEPEERDGRHLGDEPGEQVARARALDGEHAEFVGDLLDRHALAPDEVLEPGEIRFGGGQQELVGGRPEDDAVLDDEAAVVAPGRVLGVARRARPDVAREDAGQEVFRVRAR